MYRNALDGLTRSMRMFSFVADVNILKALLFSL